VCSIGLELWRVTRLDHQVTVFARVHGSMVVRERRQVGGTELRVLSPYRSGGSGKALTLTLCSFLSLACKK
jgi:hypothetical protein